MMNYQMYQTYTQIVDVLNNSGLPIGAGYYIVKEVLSELEKGYQEAVQKEEHDAINKPDKPEVLAHMESGDLQGGSES